MQLDGVHDVQLAYRKILDGMSRPGWLRNMGDEAGKVQPAEGCLPSTLVIALTLLDTEVTFKVFSENEAMLTKRINQLTYARAVEAENADFIFVLQDAVTVHLEAAMRLAKTGDLVNPHESATLIVEAKSLTEGRNLVLAGPGIELESSVKVETPADWVDVRAGINAEFPLGIDLIFTDPRHNLMCLPRTTQIWNRVVG